ncbi:hypothetical protein [Nodosilinea sp. LEGE 07298]|uniref:hypothetical protein n=1 Tax=Nodosilinea sp. LEGE 07298 TaxID=2777970 RepID=UPI00188047EB|nr:hypothetical protein [Nodosilinea sp. LEGE 07298]
MYSPREQTVVKNVLTLVATAGNTPVKNLSEELAEIEIIDLMHPLCGDYLRRFPSHHP